MAEDIYNFPSLKIENESDVQTVVWANVYGVDSESQTMTVYVRDIEQMIPDIPINNMISYHGIGVRIMPVARDSIVLLLKSGENYFHIGYALDGLSSLTSDLLGKKTTPILLQRYLEEGEVQLLGLSGNEVLLTNDGNVLMKSSNNSYVKLDSFSSTLEGYFANMKYEMDGVRIRAGNVRRSLSGTLRKEDYFVETEDEEEPFKPLSELIEQEDGTIEPYEHHKEFTVQVGTLQDEDGEDLDFKQGDIANSSPQTGWMSLASQVIDEKGRPMEIGGERVQFFVRMTNGGGMAITENSSFYILDNLGRSHTKFTAPKSTSDTTNSSKGLRVTPENYIDVSDSGISLTHKGGFVDLKTDKDGAPEINLSDGSGRNVKLNSMGLTLNMAEAYISLNAKEINFDAEKFTFGGMLAAVNGDTVFKAKMTAAMLDAHIHLGPSGPPAVPLMTMVMSGQIASTGVNVG